MNQAAQTISNIFTSLAEEDYDSSDPKYFYFKLKPDMEYLFSPGQRVGIFEKIDGIYNDTHAWWAINEGSVQRDSSGDLVNTPTLSSQYTWPSTIMSLLRPTWYSGDGAAFYPAATETTTDYPTNNDIANWAIQLTPLGRLKNYWARIILPQWSTALNALTSRGAITWTQTNLSFLAHMFARPS